MQRIAGLVDRQGHDVEEHVGPRVPGHGAAHHAAHLPCPHRERPALLQQPLRPHARQPDRAAHLVVERHLLAQLHDHARLVVVLQVGTDLRRVDLHRDAMASQLRGRSDARELQQLRALQRACRQQHLRIRQRVLRPAVLDPLDAARAAVLDAHPGHLHAGAHREVGPLHHRPQEGRGRVAAPMPAECELVGAQALVLCAVEVLAGRVAGLRAGRQPGLAVGMVVAQVRHAQLAGAAVVGVLAAGIAFRLLEQGQQFAVAPAGGAGRGPVVEVGPLAADVDEAVDRARSAQHAPARPHDAAVAGLGLRLDLELPGEASVVDRPEVAHRQPQPEVPLGTARLEQQHAALRVGAQPVGEHAACRARADDDEVVGRFARAHLVPRGSEPAPRDLPLRAMALTP